MPVAVFLVPLGIRELPSPPGVDAAMPGSLIFELSSRRLGVTVPGNLLGEPLMTVSPLLLCHQLDLDL